MSSVDVAALNPRDPDNEIHLVLTPYEAAMLMRVLLRSDPDEWRRVRPICDALNDAEIVPATTGELADCRLHPAPLIRDRSLWRFW